MKAQPWIAVALAAALGLGAGVALSAASRRPADAILAELDGVKLPTGFLDEANAKLLIEACRRRADLELELFETWPNHARVPSALSERWAYLENTFHEHDRVLSETEAVLAHRNPSRLASVARRARAWSSVNAEHVAVDECLRRIDAARPAATDDEWTAAMLVQLASYRTVDPELQRSLCRRVVGSPKLPPESRVDAEEWLTLVAKVGRPLALDFDDVESKAPASISEWKRRPVLVHVRRASDWQPLQPPELRAIEERHRDVRLVVAQVLIGKPETEFERWERTLVAPDDGTLTGWDMRFGIRRTPLFLLADAAGVLIGVSQALAPLEARLAAARH